MREKQLIQLLQFIFVWVLIWFFVTFVTRNCVTRAEVE